MRVEPVVMTDSFRRKHCEPPNDSITVLHGGCVLRNPDAEPLLLPTPAQGPPQVPEMP
jgi:hypothetical protein